MRKFNLWDCDDDETFVLTAAQLRDIVGSYALYGRKDFEAERYEDVEYGEGDCDRCARDYNRLRRLHDVTAGHLMKARAELADLRMNNELMESALDRWCGSDAFGHDVPDHYAGDGYVTCSRAMEAVCEQNTVCRRTPQQTWWWLSAFKYVWRMWSKKSPRGDVEKAIDCLMHVLELLDGETDER